MRSSAEKIPRLWKRVLSTQLLQGNTFSVNLLLFLGLTGFMLIGVDLGSQLALDKDEISIVLETGNTSPVILNANTSGAIFFGLDQFGLVDPLNFTTNNQEYTSCPNDRAPPRIN